MRKELNHDFGGWPLDQIHEQIVHQWPALQFVPGSNLGSGILTDPGVAGPVLIIKPTADGVTPPASDDTGAKKPVLANIWETLRNLSRRAGRLVAPPSDRGQLGLWFVTVAVPGGLVALLAWWMWKKAKR